MPNPYSPMSIFERKYTGPFSGAPESGGPRPPGQPMPMVPFKEGMRPDTPLAGLESSMPPLPPKPDMAIGLGPQLPVPDMDAVPDPSGLGGPMMFDSGYDMGSKIPGSMSFKGGQAPDLGNAAALQGLAANQTSNTDPRFGSIRLASDLRQQGLGMGQEVGAPTLAMANSIEKNAMGSFPQQNPAIQASLDMQHPAVSGLAERSARQKAYPQQAEAYGKIKSADITGEADVQKQILASQATNLQSLRQAQPSTIQALSELMKLMAIENLTPEQKAQQEMLRQLYLGILQRPANRGGL